MKKQLSVVISGGAGTGKTSVSLLIKRALKKAGFENTHIIDNEECTQQELTRLEGMLDNLDSWKTDTEVTISEIQTARRAFEEL